MAVETVAHIRAVRYIFHDTVFLTELFNLQATQALCRGSVDRIENTVLFLVLVDLLVNVSHNLQSKLSILADGFSIVQLLQLVEGCDTKGSGHRFQKRLNLITRL